MTAVRLVQLFVLVLTYRRVRCARVLEAALPKAIILFAGTRGGTAIGFVGIVMS